jgi:hypothetical protein
MAGSDLADRRIRALGVRRRRLWPLLAIQPVGDKIHGDGYGNGPVYWSGQVSPWYTSGETGVILVNPSVTVPVTVTFIGPGGTGSVTFNGATSVSVPPAPGRWAYASGAFLPSVPGCWTMRATFATTTVLVNFSVVPGQPPLG